MMRHASVLLFGFEALAAVLQSGCVRGPTFAYRLTPSPDTLGLVTVEMTCEAPRSGRYSLRGHATAALMGITAVAASDQARNSLPVSVSMDPEDTSATSPLVPHVHITARGGGLVKVVYRVRIGAPEGSAHLGFTGRSYGGIGQGWTCWHGRNLFLVPDIPAHPASIRVSVVHPPGYRLAATWIDFGTDGAYQPSGFEDLLNGSILLTRKISRDHCGPHLLLTGPRGVADSSLACPTRTLGRIGDYFTRALGWNLSTDYTVIGTPVTERGDAVMLNAGMSGQAGTLIPLTTERVFGAASALADRFLRFDPRRRAVMDTREYWLVDAARIYLAWRSLAASGWLTPSEALRSIADDYRSATHATGIVTNLEVLYDGREPKKVESETIGPAALACFDALLRRETGGRDSVESVLREVFYTGRAQSFWGVASRHAGTWLERFRSRYVRGEEQLPIGLIDPPLQLTPAPFQMAPQLTRTLTVALTGKTEAFLENCGCKVSQSGGVARRASVLRDLRARYPELLVLDAGNTFLKRKHRVALDELAIGEERTALRAVSLMAYDAMAVGTSDLSGGARHFQSQTAGLALPFLASNVRLAGGPLLASWRLLPHRGPRIAVVGVFEPPSGHAAFDPFEEYAGDYKIEDPFKSACSVIDSIRNRVDLVFLLGRLSPSLIRRLTEARPEIDAIFTTEATMPLRPRDKASARLRTQETFGFLGRTLVAQSYLTRYGVLVLHLGLDERGRIALARPEERWLFADVPDEPHVARVLDRFYGDSGRMVAARGNVNSPFADDSLRMKGVYVGVSRCAVCHPAEYAQWQTTGHASAYKTLLEAHRQYQPRCVSCHVVGFGAPTGFVVGSRDEHLANVQCEVCHGPGGKHAAEPGSRNVVRQVAEATCLRCHDADHSDRFIFGARLRQVLHRDSVVVGMGRSIAGRSP